MNDLLRHACVGYFFARRRMALLRHSLGSGGFPIKAKSVSAEAVESLMVRSFSRICSSGLVRGL